MAKNPNDSVQVKWARKKRRTAKGGVAGNALQIVIYAIVAQAPVPAGELVTIGEAPPTAMRDEDVPDPEPPDLLKLAERKAMAATSTVAPPFSAEGWGYIPESDVFVFAGDTFPAARRASLGRFKK